MFLLFIILLSNSNAQLVLAQSLSHVPSAHIPERDRPSHRPELGHSHAPISYTLPSTGAGLHDTADMRTVRELESKVVDLQRRLDREQEKRRKLEDELRSAQATFV